MDGPLLLQPGLLGRLQRGSCEALTEPSVDSRRGGPSSLALPCRRLAGDSAVLKAGASAVVGGISAQRTGWSTADAARQEQSPMRGEPLLVASVQQHSDVLGVGPRKQWLGVSVALKTVPAAET
ncbi:unnamed protein product [Rangifer tarandus platyrhynchus]|uniref:Uncharacterized protein n=1 Tax=Rangifer tarandus platyrhynchus TaxID=3082113 RepID=A0AC59ZEX5_RANTA